MEASIVREWCASGDMQVSREEAKCIHFSCEACQSSSADLEIGGILLQAVSLRGLLLCEEQEVPDTRLVLSIAAGIAAGMEYLHAHNIVHGGLHPTGYDLIPEYPFLCLLQTALQPVRFILS